MLLGGAHRPDPHHPANIGCGRLLHADRLALTTARAATGRWQRSVTTASVQRVGPNRTPTAGDSLSRDHGQSAGPLPGNAGSRTSAAMVAAPSWLAVAARPEPCEARRRGRGSGRREAQATACPRRRTARVRPGADPERRRSGRRAPIRGRWWADPQSDRIFAIINALADSRRSPATSAACRRSLACARSLAAVRFGRIRRTEPSRQRGTDVRYQSSRICLLGSATTLISSPSTSVGRVALS